MPEDNNGGWDEHRRLVEYRLEGLDNQMSCMRKEHHETYQQVHNEISSLRREIQERNLSQDREIVGLRMKVLALGMGAGLGGGGLGMGLLKLIEKLSG